MKSVVYMDRVSVTITDHIAEVTLARPDKLNAWDQAMFKALSDMGERLSRNEDLRAVVLTGQGRAFSAGLDMAMMTSFSADLEALRRTLATPIGVHSANAFQHPCTIWADMPVPVIAAINGACFGAGMQLALGADIRICAPDAKLSIMEMHWGLIPDMGLTKLLPGLMRADQALELILSAEQIDGNRAKELGLVTQVTAEPLSAARALAKAITARNPQAVRGAKALVRTAWPGDDTALALEARLQAAIVGTPNQVEAVRAGMEKRTPKFR